MKYGVNIKLFGKLLKRLPGLVIGTTIVLMISNVSSAQPIGSSPEELSSNNGKTEKLEFEYEHEYFEDEYGETEAERLEKDRQEIKELQARLFSSSTGLADDCSCQMGSSKSLFFSSMSTFLGSVWNTLSLTTYFNRNLKAKSDLYSKDQLRILANLATAAAQDPNVSPTRSDLLRKVTPFSAETPRAKRLKYLTVLTVGTFGKPKTKGSPIPYQNDTAINAILFEIQNPRNKFTLKHKMSFAKALARVYPFQTERSNFAFHYLVSFLNHPETPPQLAVEIRCALAND